MMVLVDTPVWRLALRRRPGGLSAEERGLSQALAQLIVEGRVQLLGVVREELLSGIGEGEGFEKLRGYLGAFDDARLEAGDYEEAARMHNRCRAKGIAGPAIDLLICAVAKRRNWEVFTTDRDFEEYGKVVGVKRYGVPGA